MQSAEVGSDHAADHNVVEMGDHKVSIVHMDIKAQSSDHEACASADGEQPYKAQSVKHRE